MTTYRKKAAIAATPANARLLLMVEAAPVNLGELGEVAEVVFFAGVVAVETGADDERLARVVGQALTVMVTTGTAAGVEVLEKVMLWAGQLVTEAGQAMKRSVSLFHSPQLLYSQVMVPVLVAVTVPVMTTGKEVVEVTVDRAGQLVTVGAHDVIVIISVTKVVLWAITAPAKRAETMAKRILTGLRGICEDIEKDDR
jgi:hypothetical protein